jgi:hypothetical protein
MVTERVLGAGLWSPFFNFHFGGQRPVRHFRADISVG